MRLGGAVVALAFAAVVGALSYEFGTRNADGGSERPPASRVFTARAGDVVRVPPARTRCEVTQEGGIPNLFCTPEGGSGYQVVFWADSVDVYDLPRVREPMVPTYSVPAVHCGKISDRGRLIEVDLAEGEFPLSCGAARAVMGRYLRRPGRGHATVRHGGRIFECRTARPDREGWDYHCSYYEDPGTPEHYVDVGAGRRPTVIP